MEYKFILNNNDNDNDNDNHLLENIIRNCEFLKHTESRFEVIYQDSEKLIVNSIHNSGNSLKQVIESYKKYNKPISVLLSIDIPGSDRGEVFFEEFMEAVENIPIAFLSNSLLAKKAFQNRSDRIASSTIISNQEDFNQFIYNISGICIVSHTKFCFHKYLKNSFSNFQSCFYV